MMKDNIREQYWREKFNEYKNTGKSQRQWCDENNLNSRSFNYWYNKFKKIEEINVSKEKPEDIKTKWIPIKVEKEIEIKEEKIELDIKQESIESGITIHIGKARIEINKEFNSESLIKVVKVVNLLC